MAEDISAVGSPYSYAYAPATPPANNQERPAAEAAEPVADNETVERAAPATQQTLNSEQASTASADNSGPVTPTQSVQSATANSPDNNSSEPTTPGAMLDLYA